MKLGNELIKEQFEDIDGKIDFLIELCHSLQAENKELTLTVKGLEAELDKKKIAEEQFTEQEAFVQSKISGFLKKLDGFSKEPPMNDNSNL